MLASLRKELRELRKENSKPVSRMLKHEVVMELEKLRKHKVSEVVGAVEPKIVKKAVEKVVLVEKKKNLK